jgi:hypothetical protein
MWLINNLVRRLWLILLEERLVEAGTVRGLCEKAENKEIKKNSETVRGFCEKE